MTTTLLRAHDLLWVSETPVATDGAPLPDWAITACRQGAPVVVRRAPRGTDGSVPVGLRGGARHERCAATVAANRITRVVSPEALAAQATSIAHDAPFAALRTLRALAPGLNALGWAWGPTGGAGFALASGLPVLHADSDLDLVVRMPRAPSTAQRDQLVRLFSDTAKRTPGARVVGYTLNTPLFSDYAEKQRYVYVPAGKTATYAPSTGTSTSACFLTALPGSATAPCLGHVTQTVIAVMTGHSAPTLTCSSSSAPPWRSPGARNGRAGCVPLSAHW